jgi:hypothetical protein
MTTQGDSHHVGTAQQSDTDHNTASIELLANSITKIISIFEQKIRHDDQKNRRDYKLKKRESWMKQAQIYLSMHDIPAAKELMDKIKKDELEEEEENQQNCTFSF